MIYLLLGSLLAGASAFAVQSVRLGTANTQLALERGTSAALKRQLDETQAQLTDELATVARQSQTDNAEVAALKAQLSAAEEALVKAHDPVAAGEYARRVLSGQADPADPGDGGGAPVPHVAATA
jgi:capsule polysaccharide export protein KpsE/RkpR